MTPIQSFARHPEDIPDQEVRFLRRLGFSAAVEVIYRWRQEPKPSDTQLDFMENFISSKGLIDASAERYAVAQAAQFLTQPQYFLEYVPENCLEDREWLRFLIEEKSASDIEIAFQVARSKGISGMPDVESIRSARESLGLQANEKSQDLDTIDFLVSGGTEGINSRHLLSNRAWMEERVVRRDLSDGDIAKELGRIGFPCDRSTVRLYRKMLGLQRSKFAEDPED